MKQSFFVALLSLAVLAGPVLAESPRAAKGFKLPANAVEVAPDVFSLGTAYDAQSRSMVEGLAIVHKKASAKSNAAKVPRTPTCYGYLATGAKWKGTPENWMMNPSNTYGLDGSTLFTTQTADIQKWEDAAAFDILGNGTATGATLSADETATDGLNEVYFDSITDSNTIAVTIIWGIFSGPTQNRKLVEWDQIYNTYYSWSATGEAGKMDFENISTHELGHAVGMGDIYTSSCSAVTMYGYGSNGETEKRTLAPADVIGIGNLY